MTESVIWITAKVELFLHGEADRYSRICVGAAEHEYETVKSDQNDRQACEREFPGARLQARQGDQCGGDFHQLGRAIVGPPARSNEPYDP